MRLRSLAAVAALVAAPLVTLTPPATAATTQASQCLVAAHRGNTNVPSTTATENGMVAARRAVAAGADFLEADAQVTADDRLMLMHDATVDRTTNGTGTMISKTSAQVRALRLDDGSQVPFMTDLLDYAKQTHTRVLLELKSMGGTASWNEVVSAVTALGEDQVVIQSLSTSILDKVHTLLPDVQRVLVTLKQVPPDAARTYGGVMIDYAAVTDAYLDSMAGIPVYVYLVNDATNWARFTTKVDGIVTNKPGAYLTYRQGVCGSGSTISPADQAPTADAGTATCTGLDCSFSATASADPDGDPLTYTWDFGDGTQAQGVTATHSYTDGGPRTVTLTATDNHGLSGTATVVVDPVVGTSAGNHPPTAVAGAATCQALTCSFDGGGSGDVDGDSLAYSWDFGDGTAPDTTRAPSHTFPSAGAHTVTLTVDDGHGATGVDTLDVTTTEATPDQPPTAQASTPTCTALTCSFSAAGSSDPEGAALSYDWDFGDGVHGQGLTTTHTYAAAGAKAVTLTVTDPGGALGTATLTATPTAPAAVPIVFVSAASTNGNRTSHTVTVPTSVKAGDALLLFFTGNSSTATYTGPAGWKALQTKNGDGIAVRAFTKVATAADVGHAVKVTSSAYVKSDLTVSAYRGTAAAGPVAASAVKVDNASGATHVSPAVTAVGSGSWLVSYWGDKSSATTRWTAPSGQSVRASSFGSSTGHVSALLTDSNGRVAAGASGQKTAVANAVSSRGASVSVLLAGS